MLATTCKSPRSEDKRPSTARLISFASARFSCPRPKPSYPPLHQPPMAPSVFPLPDPPPILGNAQRLDGRLTALADVSIAARGEGKGIKRGLRRGRRTRTRAMARGGNGQRAERPKSGGKRERAPCRKAGEGQEKETGAAQKRRGRGGSVCRKKRQGRRRKKMVIRATARRPPDGADAGRCACGCGKSRRRKALDAREIRGSERAFLRSAREESRTARGRDEGEAGRGRRRRHEAAVAESGGGRIT